MPDPSKCTKQIRYLVGDATQPQGEGNKIIAHVVNDQGAWGKGFVLAISKRWMLPKAYYESWYEDRKDPLSGFKLGVIQVVQVEREIMVANMIAQHGIKTTRDAGVPIRYRALRKCLSELARQAAALGASVHMPRIGCGLAGGRWEAVEPLIVQELLSAGVPVTVYDLEPSRDRE